MSAHLAVATAALAGTGSNVIPWVLVAGIIVLLGVIALIVAGVVRSRRAEHEVEDAAERVAEAGGTLPEPDPDASPSEETVIDEANELGGDEGSASRQGEDQRGAESGSPDDAR